jgi:alpha-amylase/alpha-mannosidase (GH57 family)
MTNRYLCIHGHFYQPPRENPWLEEIEVQDSARPFHDWNGRVTAECYHPNAFSRILNGNKEIVDIVNNYSKISFNFGPTLLSWMEKYNKEAYNAILEADKISMERFGGHGGAIAQVYNHIIMPLANREDKETQVIWGIADFESRFKRKPEGMWLAETAVDTETLEILAQNNIKFTILAPSQCKKTRKTGAKEWQSEENAKVDPKKPYLCNLPSGKTITLFFYDGPISQGIAFGDTLKSGERFAARLLSAFDTRREPQRVHIATDGETYGHHQKFADMALAYCINYVEQNQLAQMTVYGQYMELFPPQYEAAINENTSWSCAHGVERWRGNCGCNSGCRPEWNQEWRAPLRSALDFARDIFLATFENKGKEYFKDIRAARNAYIDVILDRSKTQAFLNQHGTGLALSDKPAAFKLMEMQRNAMLMYTSCGWFFDEISGIETVQVITYAKRALGYNKSLTGEDREKQFMEKLALAPSNIPSLKNGEIIYRQMVQPASVGLRKVAVNYAVSYMLDEILFEDRVFIYNISDQKVEVSRHEGARLLSGTGVFTSVLTTEARTVSFAVLHTGGPDIAAGSIYGQTDNLEQIKEVFNFGEMEQCKALIKGSFVDIIDIKGLLKEKQRQILASAIEKAKKRIRGNYLYIFEQEHDILNYVQELGVPMPKLFLSLSEFALNMELKDLISRDNPDTVKIGGIIGNLKNMSANIETRGLENILTKKLNALVDIFASDVYQLERAAKLIDLLSFCETFSLPIKLYRAQNIVFIKVSEMPQNVRQNPLIKTLCRKLNLDLD